MKRLLSMLTIIMVAVNTTFVNAQTKTTVKKSDSSKVVHTKKDGTADKRYKENKSSTTATGPLKRMAHLI